MVGVNEISGKAVKGLAGRTGGAEDEVEVFGLAVFGLDPGRGELLDGTGDKVDLGIHKLVSAWLAVCAGGVGLT